MQRMKNHFHIKMGIQNIFCRSFSDFIPSSVPKIVILQEIKKKTYMYTKI